MSAPHAGTAPDPTRQRRGHSLQRASLAILLAGALLLVGLRVYPYPWLFPTFPHVTHTARGGAGDPLNVILVGSTPQLTAGFARAGWVVPDPITPATSARIAADSLAHRPYPTAPVSNLYVFGRAQDLAFERPTGDVEQRGHVRLWQTTARLDGQPVWLGAATYDQGIELSSTTSLPTHHIAPEVDQERDAVGADLARTGLVAAEAHEPFTPPVFVAFNGGGDYYASDGQVLVITYRPVPLPRPAGFAAVVTGLDRGLFYGYDVLLTTLPLAVAAVLLGTILVVLAGWPAARWILLWCRAAIDRRRSRRRTATGKP